MMITIQLPDGTFAQKPIDALQPDDMIVFDACEAGDVGYVPRPMDWDFEAQAPKDRGSFEIASVAFEPKPGGLDWSAA